MIVTALIAKRVGWPGWWALLRPAWGGVPEVGPFRG